MRNIRSRVGGGMAAVSVRATPDRIPHARARRPAFADVDMTPAAAIQ
jgi:hypothetical protein